MYTIKDYIKYYKNYDFKEMPWNIMDNLLCAIIAYIPLNSFKYSKTITTICDEILKKGIPSKADYMVPVAVELLNMIKDTKRYKDMKLKNFVSITDDNTQFGALSCIIQNKKIISFRGTDKSVIGWLENFRIMYQYPTHTQELAIEYLRENITIFDKEVYVTGHSKGGNLAMASAMELREHDFNKIKKVINFDGPGFRKAEYTSVKFEKLKSKLINVIPTGSYIGVLMFNDNYKVVTSNSHAINVHFPNFWNSYGTVFIEGEQSKLSKELHNMTSKNIEALNEEQIRSVIEKMFQELDRKSPISLANILNILKSVKDMDRETTKYFHTIISSMLKLSSKNK